jgi:hypothetical protein
MITANVSFGQTFIGKQSNKFKIYNCSIRINKDSSVNFIYDRDLNGVYGDHYGSINKINDTLFRVSATMTIGQFYMKSFNNDTIYIQLDSNIARQLDKIQIEYTDGKTRKQLQGYDRMGNPVRLLKVPVDKKLFNEKKGMDFITITINRKNFLTDNFLSFKIPFGSAASFTSGQKITFDVIIKTNKLWTVGQPPLQTGHFKLDKKSGISRVL